MMVKSSTEYYNLEKVAEVLSVPTAEANRLREQGKLRGFRDGSAWKFLKEEVHSYLAEQIKARGANGQAADDDSDFDLGDEESSFDLLVEDAVLPDDFDLISISPAKPKSDLDLGAMDEASELALAEETHISSLVVPKRTNMTEKPKSTPPSSDAVADDEFSSDLLLADDMESSAISLASDSEVHEVDLGEESLVAASSSSPQLGLAGDSGFDVLLAAEEEIVFEEDSSALVMADADDTEAITSPVEEFSLEPPSSLSTDDDSESSSQIIAIDVGVGAAAQDAEAFGPDDFGGFGGFGGADFDDAMPLQPAAAIKESDPFAVRTSMQPDAFGTPLVSATSSALSKRAGLEEEYSTGMLVALASALVVMLLPGMMLIDTMAHLWSWGDPFVLNSVLMGTISGLLGL
ncbi:MAG: helix-turn-helix domain-containing protein [Planctomycetaceae bacterium]|nr:helix-turn-helix domain-containing protein [Planctomycetaceae bacterium]